MKKKELKTYCIEFTDGYFKEIKASSFTIDNKENCPIAEIKFYNDEGYHNRDIFINAACVQKITEVVDDE